MRKVRRALISVFDKAGLKEFADGLSKLGVEILSTGGTMKLLKDTNIPVKSVSEYTGFPEMMNGRVKTLHPKIHGGLLSLRENPEHMQQAKNNGIELIDMVVVNLYPFEKTVAKPGVKFEEAIENIDIGGPSMLRSGAKNYRSVAVICNPARYSTILKELQDNDGTLSEDTLSSLAVDVFTLTAGYDKAISDYLSKSLNKGAVEQNLEFPDTLSVKYKRVQGLRYGENPHQKAAFYKDETIDIPSVPSAKQIHGKELSFNNILDLNAALEIVKEFEMPAASVIKHTNPCGAAIGDNLAEAYKNALACDPLSAFGSIIGLNKIVDTATAENISQAGFVEAVIAPGYEDKALEILKQKKNLRILETGSISSGTQKIMDMKSVVGGILVQDYDQKAIKKEELKVVTKTIPSDSDIQSLIFGWNICKHVKSNAIVLVKDGTTIGIGAGQMSRVDSVIISCRKAGDKTKDSVLASDAFFPKPDAIEQAHKAGIKAIIQPGGSIGDKEIIEACDKYGITMVFTGARHFKH